MERGSSRSITKCVQSPQKKVVVAFCFGPEQYLEKTTAIIGSNPAGREDLLPAATMDSCVSEQRGLAVRDWECKSRRRPEFGWQERQGPAVSAVVPWLCRCPGNAKLPRRQGVGGILLKPAQSARNPHNLLACSGSLVDGRSLVLRSLLHDERRREVQAWSRSI